MSAAGKLAGMPSQDLPAEVGRSVEQFLASVDKLAPGLVSGFYLVGSVALGDFHPRGAGRGRLTTASDIDFIAVTDLRLERKSREMQALAEAHARTVARFPRPYFDGAVLTWTELAAGPDNCPDVPCAQESRFTPAGRSGINPVAFCELAWHGIAVRGPQPAEVDLWADRNALHAYTLEISALTGGRGGGEAAVASAAARHRAHCVVPGMGSARCEPTAPRTRHRDDDLQMRCRPVCPEGVRPALAAHRRREPVPAHRRW